MAGAGYKLFNTGDVLTAAQVNTYLMQQTVMVFASSAARTSALSGVLAEGMVSYLQDTNTLEVYDGSSWVGATGDITGLTAGTGISISSATGPVPTVTNSMATEITAKGDLIVGTGSGTFDNLAAGSSGDTLVADSAASTGLRWSSGTNLDNPIINSSMQIWQRGTTSADSAGSPYTADRWQLSRSSTSGATVTRQATGDTTNLPSIQYCARVQRNSGNTSTNLFYFTQTIETANSIPFAGKSLTVSFYARAGANYSAASSILKVELITGTGSDQNVVTGLTSQTVIGTRNATLTTTWQRFSFTATMGATATQLAFATTTAPVGTAGAADYFEITGVQIDVGSVALPFRTSTGTLQGELAACQRYYWRVSGVTPLSMSEMRTTSTAGICLPNPVRMRTNPTLDANSGSGYYIAKVANSSLSIDGAWTADLLYASFVELFATTATTSTAGYAGFVYLNNASTYFGLSAEL